MKKLWLGIIGLAAASTAHAAIVTYTLSINESTTGTVLANNFVVWATVSPGDNFGLATYGVDLNTGFVAGNSGPREPGPTVTVTQRSPGGTWNANSADENFDPDAAYPPKTGGFTLVRQSNDQAVYSGSQDLLSTPDVTMHKVMGMGQTAGSMATITPAPYHNTNGTDVTTGPYGALSGSNITYGTATNRTGVPTLAAGSIRLFTGVAPAGTIGSLQIQNTADTSAAVWLTNLQSDIAVGAATVNLAFRDFAGVTAADTVTLSAAPANANQTVGPSIAVTGAGNSYTSEVDQLLDPSVNKGSAVIQTIHGEPGSVYVMAKLLGTAADIAAVAALGVTSSDSQFTPLHAIYDSQFGAGGFNALFKFANISGDAKAFNWDLAAHTGVTVDQLAAVPEPATMGLMAFAGLGLLARRRRNA